MSKTFINIYFITSNYILGFRGFVLFNCIMVNTTGSEIRLLGIKSQFYDLQAT